MSHSETSRRRILTGMSSVAAAATLGATAARAATTKHLDLATPQGNLDGYLKSRSDIGGNTSVTYAMGTVVSKIPGRKARVLMKTHAVNMTRCLKDATGYVFLQRECVIFCDVNSGEPLKTWFNPFVDRECEVFHIQNESVSSHYDVNGARGPYHMDYLELAGEVTFYNDLFYSSPSPLSIEDYPAYAQSNLYEGAGLYHWHTNRADLDNADLSSAATNTSHIGVRQWLPWMEMGGWDGELVLPSRGKKLREGGVKDIPKPFLTWMEKNMPVYLEPPPVEQKEERRSFYGEFKKHIDAKRAAQKK
ncbi:MAG: DUF1838 domain-containing protein [Rhodospirillaceae bacterium]|nr:DUF1838 domain-containing protein [Rhodospirillaceae bacterium]